MPVLAIFTGKGFTKAKYDALRGEVKWETDHPVGGIMHACGFDDAGDLHVADVWQSADEMNAFVGARLMPGLQKLGIPAPSVQLFPLHNLTAYSVIKSMVAK